MRALLAAAFLAAATPAFADETIGTVRSYEPATNTLTLSDRTVWYLPATVAVPEGLKPGERVRIAFRSNADNGWGSVTGISRVAG
jgi:multidrug efflux pump subunit AcrA (membrane-fusion protein)